MSLPTIEPLPDEIDTLPPARRRRQRRLIVPPGSSERADFLGELSRKTVPSFDFFLFSMLAGVVLGVGLLVDSAALVFLAALLAPFFSPMLGISLGTVTGAARFLLQSLASLIIGSLIIFLCGAVAGLAVPLLPEHTYLQATYHANFTWPDFIVLALGAGLTALLITRAPQQRPLITSAAIAYALYLPAGVAGFGLGSGISGLWPNALGLYLIHLLWAALIGTLVLGLVGLRPLNAAGYLLSAVYAIAGIAAIALLYVTIPGLPAALVPGGSGGPGSGEPTAVNAEQAALDLSATPLAALNATSTITPDAGPTTTRTKVLTRTPTRTLVPSATATHTVTPVPTPVWAYIAAVGGDGAMIREEPSYDALVVSSILNGTLVEVLPDVQESGGVAWMHIRMANGKEGWIVRNLLRTATPAPGW